MSPCSSIMLNVDGRTLYIREWPGTGPACLLIHGFGESSHVWEEFTLSLNGECRALAVDLRGHGDSEWDPAGIYSIHAHVQDIVSIVKTLCPEGTILIGHSLGGEIAIRVTRMLPDLITGLVVVDFSPDLELVTSEVIRNNLESSIKVYSSFSEYASWLQEGRPLISPTMAYRLACGALKTRDDGRFILKIDPMLVKSSTEPRDADFLWNLLCTIQCSSLVIRGIGSAILRSSVAEKMVKVLRNGRLKVVEYAGHAVMTDNPEGFFRAVHPFLSEIAPSTTVAFDKEL